MKAIAAARAEGHAAGVAEERERALAVIDRESDAQSVRARELRSIRAMYACAAVSSLLTVRDAIQRGEKP